MVPGRALLIGFTGLLLIGCSQGSEDVQSSTDALHKGGGDDKVFSFDYYLPVSHGATLHVIEKFSARSFEHHRGILALTGTLVTCDQYNVAVDGYNVLDRLAQHGYWAYCATYEGYGDSSRPADGNDVTKDRLLDEMGDVVEWARHLRHIGRMDMFGASLGSAIAFELGGIGSPINRAHVRRVVLTANVYKSFTPQAAAAFSGLFAFFHIIPGGYFTTDPSFYLPLVGNTTNDVITWISNNWPGSYAVGPTLAGETLPPYEASDGRAPALQVLGGDDPITPPSDAAQFGSEYGGSYELYNLPGAGHSPYFNPVKEQFWSKVFDFLDSDSRGDGCDQQGDGESE